MPNTNEADQLYKQQTDLQLIELLLPFLKQKTFLDIGAERGTFTRFLVSRGLQGALFEPLPIFGNQLSSLAQQGNCKFFPFAIDDKDKTADFYEAFDHKNNPLDYFSSLHPLINDERIIHKKTTEVSCRSLDSLFSEGLIDKKVGLIKIDTEGNDLNVLKGMNEVSADIVLCEYFMPGIYSGWKEGHPLGLIDEAQKKGFHNYIAIKRIHEYEIVSLNHAGFIKQQWGNLIFLKDEIFTDAKEKIATIIAEKEIDLLTHFLNFTKRLQGTAQERLELINSLDHTGKQLQKDQKKYLDLIHQLQLENSDLYNKNSHLAFLLHEAKLLSKLKKIIRKITYPFKIIQSPQKWFNQSKN